MMVPETALKWAAAPGVAVGDVLYAWHCESTVDVPVGREWDVVRLTAFVGWGALALMRTDGHDVGPVLEARPHPMIEVVVPPGSAAVWPWPGRPECVPISSGFLRCPPPWITSLRPPVNGRCWAFAPGTTSTPYTDPDALCEAAATVVASLRRRTTPVDDERELAHYEARRLTLAHR